MTKPTSYNLSLRAISLWLMTALLTLATPPAEAQTNGAIHIGGKVYGGGKEGAIGTSNTTDACLTEADSTQVTVTNNTLVVSDVQVHSGNIKTVFGGGEQGRSYGKTSVSVSGGTIGIDGDADLANGNVFGAGDGCKAHVYGGSSLLVTGGTIKQSVYGGGNEADLMGSTLLTLRGGTYVGAVYGGAKLANIFGRTFINVDGENATNDLHIIDVYGGNDIAGEIQPSEHWTWTQKATVEASLPTLYDGTTFALANTPNLTKKPTDVVDGVTLVNGSWNAFVLATKGTTYKTLIDNVYGGGNGDYDYASNMVAGKETNPYAGKSKPVIGKTYLQLEGGMYGSVYGGGNAATVAQSTDICLINDTEASKDYLLPLGNLDNPDDPDHPTTTSLARFSPDYQFNRVFGGNNKEPMAIRPNWYLEKASVNNLYSGGNAGAMTYFYQTSTGGAQSLAGKAGILIHIASDDMTVNNVYGGCRMADVDPNAHQGRDMTINAETIDGYSFPQNYAARVLISGGKINNVYGGNDVSGIVYYGSDVEIRSSIIGNVYGAGNGSYAYTDNANLKDDPIWGDYYYDPGTRTSAEALNIHRPNASTSLVHIIGTDAEHPTYIGGGVYCGGNSATLRANINNHETTYGDLAGATANLKLGSYVIADKVFLGSNGENMVKSETANDLLQIYKNGPAGYDSSLGKFNTMDLTTTADFEDYMRGVEVAIRPTVTFDAGYEPHSTKIGSLYGGGNVGSMTSAGTFKLTFLDLLVIYDKLVGGCNNANVAKTEYNAFHMGGLTNNTSLENGNKVQLDIAGVQLEPRKLTYNPGDNTFSFDWNVEDIAGTSPAEQMLVGANIYGGCYSSGYVNGGVDINISKNAISDDVFTNSGVTFNAVRDDVLASTLAAYGGGYGQETEIWGNVSIDITENGQIMKAYGGGEMGVVGKLKRNADGIFLTDIVQEWYSHTVFEDVHGYNTPVTEYDSKDHSVAKFSETYNAIVNLNANLLADNKLNVAKLYGGGFQGTISGNTTVNLNRGRVYDAFGGASNADIIGHTEMYVGKTSAPQVTNNVYGANDFGGLIVGHKTHLVDNNKDGDSNDAMEKIVAQSYVEYNSGKISGNIFGGPCGAYEYDDDRYFEWDLSDPLNPAKGSARYVCKPQLLEDLLTAGMLTPLSGAGYAANSFVNVISQSTLDNDVISGYIFGAGQGLKGHINLADERGSYVRLMSATKSQRTTGELSHRVYGAGFCSNTNRSLVDAHTGYFGSLFGGAHGITYQELTTMELTNPEGHYETNYMGFRSAVRLYEMTNNQMDIYGGGANAGAQETGVVLNGGEARYIYGASFAQGISYASSVEIPETSTSRAKAIFGGAEGGSDAYPCDAYNTFVTWKSPNARVQDAIYGGNNAYRMTRNAYISVSTPVKNFEDKLTNVFGGGYGENTVTLYTNVSLLQGAQVANVYGGGNNGQVLDTPSFRYYLDDGQMQCVDGHTKLDAEGKKIYPASLDITADTPDKDKLYGYQKYLRDSEVIGFHNWIVQNCWKPDPVTGQYQYDSRNQPLGSYTANAHGHAHPVYFLSTQMDDMKNTNVFINKGAIVAENAYGGGLGEKATVSGETSVKLLGGTVRGDIYGGGYGGHVEEYPHLIYPAGGQHEMTLSATNVNMQGGISRNVYGGGLNGRVTGSTNVILGTKDEHEFDFYGTHISGDNEHKIIYGDPIVERSLYGGGQMGPVHGTAYLTLNQGHIGYKYDASHETSPGVSNADCYVENLDLNDPDDRLLDQNGNAFGAGYGEGASVDVTYVNIYGGTIRNSLYGGGEIAAVGRAVMETVGAHPVVDHIDVPGRTHIYMYKGLVQGDVFGGGRGYSYDLTGNEIIGKTLYTDGYVFGTTDVEVRGGTVGTPETVADGHGNVFGGGNIGYCFTDAVKHGKRGDGGGEGRYYTNAWKCDKCGYIDYEHNSPRVCGNCHKSFSATDATFQTTFTQVNAQGTTADVTNESILSEDCRVVISPWAQVTANDGISIKGNGKTQPDGSVLKDSTFAKGSYVPTEYLDLLKDKNTDAAQWAKLSDAGVTVRNAVFAGGNVSAGSDKVYANAYTVFGNATASVNDIFFRDFISIGTEHTGGIYGDGNLTFVDGYRELNITNYGTDYYGQQDHITLDQYNAMNDRERAYFELEYQTSSDHTDYFYTCNTPGNYGGKDYTRGQHITRDEFDKLLAEGVEGMNATNWTEGSKHYAAGDKIKESEWDKLSSTEQENWVMFGFCSIYAGRLLNSIQRADFCGVFGSRLVLQGAQDRVPEVVDYTQYTLNRVGELSLNKAEYEGKSTTGLTNEQLHHGNYFGMYNIVNYLGAITSDVSFEDVRVTDNNDSGYKDPVGDKAYGTASYYDWKLAHQADKKRNNGTAHNTVALAAGVYLEIIKEPTTPDPNAEREYGYITGIVQLDLINVKPGLGGGYVYAKNEHGARSGNPGAHQNLSVYNHAAVNNSAWTYDEGNRQLVETSGNFIHNVKQIVDDCYPAGGRWDDYNRAPAHYWYIRGEFYVYDQYISAFTGSSTAYSENINLPLTITAGANGRLDLIDIKQNFYAYYKEDGIPLGANDAIVLNGVTYGLNDLISYWDYMQLSDTQQRHFVNETYVATMDYCTSDGGPVFEKGEVILPAEYERRKTDNHYYDPEEITTNPETLEQHMKEILISDVFHVSNAVSHDNGYVLAVKLDNPGTWDSWYVPQSNGEKISQKQYSELNHSSQSNYTMGPTYYTTEGGVYGQHAYVLDDIVTKSVVDAYSTINSHDLADLEAAGKHQATVSPAYVSLAAATYDYDGQHKTVQAGVGISAYEYNSLSDANQAKFSPAYQCTSTFVEDAATSLYIYFGELIPVTKYQELQNKLRDEYLEENPGETDLANEYAQQQMNNHFDKASIVTEAGLYGGQYFQANHNYRALDTWATLSKEDRTHFNFRYDALDALLLPTYPATGEEGPGNNNVNQYDGPYWDPVTGWTEKKVYGAKQPIDYQAKYEGSDPLTWTDHDGNDHTLNNTDDPLDRVDYENLPNERRHYSSFKVLDSEVDTPFYIVKESFISGGSNYAAGRVITEEIYNTFDTQRKNKVQIYTPTEAGTYYICRDQYTVNEKGEGVSVRDIRSGGIEYNTNDVVPSGVIIKADNYSNLVNRQTAHFTIHGISPTETSTFYVNRESNVFDLTKDRIVTVIYQYKYEESDETGNNVEEITERHVVNIHITFKSGVPTIGKLQEPSIVLPGETVGLKSPNVTPGAYEILGGGWELFTTPEDAEKHQNGKAYVNNATQMYWYQDGYYVAYYAKTYLGKTYSNSVKFKVANYHDIADVMADTENFMFIDHKDVKRNSKIYIDNSYTDENPDATKSEIDMLYDLFDKTLNKEENKKPVLVDVQETDANGPLYYETDSYGNKLNTTTNTPSPYPVYRQETQYVQKISDHARNCANLDFFLNEDVKSIKSESEGWTPIGSVNDNLCFMGTLHGMGHTINGLDNSLFENLCGYVYNLGVTGSFTKSGVADRVSDGTVPDTGNPDPENYVAPTVIHGHVNSSWIYTSADPADVSTASANPADLYYPVVGTPNDLMAGRDGDGNVTDMLAVVGGMHTLNCYYPEGSGYPESHTHGETANSATLRQFNNGEVAYNLNGFYLNKRYSDAVLTEASIPEETTSPTTGDNAVYKYWKQDSDGNLIRTGSDAPATGYYLGGGSMHAYDGKNLGYVERLFADGDFVYKYGTIPIVTNERYSTSESRYLPVWPDDYLFFGQTLTYGYDEINRPYEPLPSHIRKTVSIDGSGKDNRLLTTNQNNIIYRVPAYYRSSEKSWIHFNPYSVFAEKMKSGFTLSQADQDRGLTPAVLDGGMIHPGLTAIDFSGFNDRAIMTAEHKFQSVPNSLAFSNGSRYISSKPGYEAKYAPLNDGTYFGPITDYTVLMDIETHDITQNLLAYAPTASWSGGTANTLSVLQGYFKEPEYSAHYSDDKYRKVDAVNPSTVSSVHGHLVMKENTTDARHYYYAASDHFLVDKQDFNAPIEYEFIPAKGEHTKYRMWYQRTPELYANLSQGWEGISIPFSAELVSTQQKGEITHFYNSAPGAAYNAGKTSGHEYWLREFTEVVKSTDSDPSANPDITTAIMNYPVEGTDGNKSVTNTFLWDYYYNADGIDANGDLYKKTDGTIVQDDTRTYYSNTRTYDNYPLSMAGKPYIIGFPGSRYYEFDLSGTFVPQNSGSTTPAKLDAQTVSFVSETGITIHVSDDELDDSWTNGTFRDYTFAPNYLNDVAPVSQADGDAFFVLNATGSSFDKTTESMTDAERTVSAFRPYFAYVKPSATPAPSVRSIVFGMANDTQFEPDQETIGKLSGKLDIYAKRGRIIVESNLAHNTVVNIFNISGVCIANFTIAPGETIVQPVDQSGVYVVNTQKLLVK
ncbi:MAG: hypothetical protein KBT20_01440 [Bacteroidales bacterium]|nr:hypothetical protein [Candidatus Liminaster caballi]